MMWFIIINERFKNARYNFFITFFIPHNHNQVKYSLYLCHRQESNENRVIQGHFIGHSPLDPNKTLIGKTLTSSFIMEQ